MCIYRRSSARGAQRGISLIELVLSIAIVSIALAGIVGVMNLSVGHSAEPLRRKQALVVAEALLEEIETVPFASVNTYNNLSLTGGDSGNPTSANMPAGYSASVVTVPDSTLGAGASANVLRIAVTVTYGSDSVVLEGYRTNY
jgi:MSHA pilin protein MshD